MQVRATLDNPDRKLLPGMFATVDIDVGRAAALHHAAADGDHLQPLRQHGLPGRAGQGRGRQDGSSRADLRHDRRDARRSGRGPERRQARATIVVTAGQIKLRNGAPVTINNSVQPRERCRPAARPISNERAS